MPPLNILPTRTILRSTHHHLLLPRHTFNLAPTTQRTTTTTKMSTLALISRPLNNKPTLVSEHVPLPPLGPHQLLTTVLAAAQNPTDIKSLDSDRFGPGATLGCDICGTVESIGSSVTRFRPGDRIAGLLMQGRTGRPGAYAARTIAEEGLSFKVPDGMGSAEASTVPLACNTAWLALLSPYSLGIDRVRAEEGKTEVLIWGGSSSVGQYAIQVARILGLRFATTCRNRGVVEALGAELVFDYTRENVVEEIKSALPNITYVLDCIGTVESSKLASQAVAEGGGRLCTINPGKRNTEKVEERVEVRDVIVFTAFHEELKYGQITLEVRDEDRDLSHELYEKLPGWIESGKIKANKPRIVEGGLDGVEKGFELYRSGTISGEKIVYEL